MIKIRGIWCEGGGRQIGCMKKSCQGRLAHHNVHLGAKELNPPPTLAHTRTYIHIFTPLGPIGELIHALFFT